MQINIEMRRMCDICKQALPDYKPFWVSLRLKLLNVWIHVINNTLNLDCLCEHTEEVLLFGNFLHEFFFLFCKKSWKHSFYLLSSDYTCILNLFVRFVKTFCTNNALFICAVCTNVFASKKAAYKHIKLMQTIIFV